MFAEGLIRAHYIDGLEYLYSHAACGSVTKVAGWAFFQWKVGAQQHCLCIRLTPYAPTEVLLEFLYATIKALTYVEIDVAQPGLDTYLAGVLPTLGFEKAHDIRIHLPSTEAGAYQYDDTQVEQFVGAGCIAEEVTTEDQRKLFAAIQDDAFTNILAAVPSLGEQFFPATPCVRGPDIISCLVTVDGLPARCGQVFRSRGLVSGVNGAVLARLRGHHLGDPMYVFLARAAREYWGAQEVLHFTMPTAQKTVERVGWPQLPIWYERWDMVKSPWPEIPFPPGSGTAPARATDPGTALSQRPALRTGV